MSKDQYLSIKETSRGEYKEKGSKFLAFVHPLSLEEEVKTLLERYKKEYYDARHICYAYRFGVENEVMKSSDAGEPNGAAGLPILNQLRSFEVHNVLLVVVRYFGGTKLGASGLANAYKQAAKAAMEDAPIIEKAILKEIVLSFPYIEMNNVMRKVKENEAVILDQNFEGEMCRMHIAIRESKEKDIPWH